MVSFLKPLHGTWLGAFVGHGILIPLWTLSPVPMIAAVIALFYGTTAKLCGLATLLFFALISMYRFPYSKWLVQMFYDLDLPRYYRRCEVRGKHLGEVPQEKNLFMFHPHGILAVGFVVNGCWGRHFNSLASKRDLQEERPGTVFLIARNLREWAPLFKVLCDLSGRLESATRSNIQRLMKQGRNLAIIPGGFEDATLHAFGKHRTMMTPRKGLIKYALQHGYAVTPVYSFGECETYYTFTGFLQQRLALNKWSIPAVLFFGWTLVPLFPRLESEVFTYVGKPLQLPKIPEPSPVEVDEWHAKYLAALRQLFEENKAEAGRPEARLDIY